MAAQLVSNVPHGKANTACVGAAMQLYDQATGEKAQLDAGVVDESSLGSTSNKACLGAPKWLYDQANDMRIDRAGAEYRNMHRL